MRVLAVDIGSSSVRAALVDRDGVIAPGSLSQLAVELAVEPGGRSTITLERIRALTEQAIDRTLASPPARDGIAAVGVSAFWHSLLVLDAAGRPLTDVLTWADTRSAADAADLATRLDAESVRQRTGCPLHPSYLPAKIRWLRRNQPDLFSRATRFVSLPQALTAAWLGADATSSSLASGSGLYDRQAGSWDRELLDLLEIAPEQLGAILPEPELLPPVAGDYADRWPALRGIHWRAPIGDGAAANVGAGCVRADRLTLTVGTSGAMRRCQPGEPVEPTPDGLWRYLLDRRHTVTGGALSEGGNIRAWLSDTLRLPNAEDCEIALRKRRPGEHGLTVLPFWSGERSPGWAGDATATIAGMQLHTTAEDILHACLEAIAYRFAAVYDALSVGGEQIVATGGALLASPAWQQIMADVLGVPLLVSSIGESSLRGAALLAWRDVLDEQDALTTLDPGGTVVRPRPEAHQQYRELRERQARLYSREMGSPAHGTRVAMK
ncbi:MAG TPA: carbohydrate kinase [Chloroflexi bacterium]|nr:carbohydrate kinase [Chloroflexota bacterium]